MRKKINALILSLLLGTSLYANDGVYYTSGNQLVPLLETEIRIQKEVLTISLQDDGFAMVDVLYEFYNPDSSDKTLTMGFEADPPYNDVYEFYSDGKHPHIHDFTVEMNGAQLSYKNVACLESQKELKPLDLSKYEICRESYTTVHPKDNDTLFLPFFYVYYFDATFKPGLNKIHHTYKYKESMHVGNTFEISYKLSPALRWANRQIDDFTLVIRADHTAKHYIIKDDNFKASLWTVTEGMGKQRLLDAIGSREFSLRNGAFTWHTTNFKPTEELDITSADVLYVFDENAPFGSFYDRASTVSLSFMNGIEPKDEEKRARVAHNLPYANRGHIFKNPEMKAYFESLWWYMPDPNYIDNQDDFTESDRIFLSY